MAQSTSNLGNSASTPVAGASSSPIDNWVDESSDDDYHPTSSGNDTGPELFEDAESDVGSDEEEDDDDDDDDENEEGEGGTYVGNTEKHRLIAMLKKSLISARCSRAPGPDTRRGG